MTEEQKIQVRDILLTPIKLPSKSEKKLITIEEDGEISSTQKYINSLDQDMSDLAVGFYDKLYAGILPRLSILNGEGSFTDTEFSGDTMNTFNTIANIILGDSDRLHRSPQGKWPPVLIEYEKIVRCLANFWVIPECYGRTPCGDTGKKDNHYDSVDLFLDKHKEDIGDMDKGKYFGKFKDYNDFCEKHFISSEARLPIGFVKEQYEKKYKDGCLMIVEELIADIKARALCIACSNTGERLYSYFHDECGLLS